MKRLLDLVVSVSWLFLLSPLLFVIAFLVRFFIGAPVLFRQARPGRYGKSFLMYKFRTMTNQKDDRGNLLSDEKRLTKIGEFFRRFRLDELPELFNVLKGDMSFIGPRPLLTQYLSRYTTEQMRRHEMRPGITGWAQVNGNTKLSLEEKAILDVWYVDHWSLWLDLMIIFKTVVVIVLGERVCKKTLKEAQDYADDTCRRC